MSSAPCTCCCNQTLVPHLAVSGGMGSEGLIPTTDSYGTALADIVRCTTCGHMQLDPMPADEVLETAYADAWSDDYVRESEGQRETARRVLARIEAHRAPGDLVDLGCWVGFLLDEAGRRGWQGRGVEPSAAASEYARSELGLDVVTGDLFTTDLGEATADAVVLGDVIEHLPRPGDALERIGSLLRPQGVLAMMLPDAGSRTARRLGRRWWSVLPTHVQYFTRDSMRCLLEREGWTVLEFDTQPKVFRAGYYLARLEGYSRPVGRALVRGAETVGLADRMVAPDFGDRMLVVARRPG